MPGLPLNFFTLPLVMVVLTAFTLTLKRALDRLLDLGLGRVHRHLEDHAAVLGGHASPSR